jgi:hypothetical protein
MPSKKQRTSQSDVVLRTLKGKTPPRNIVLDSLAEMHRRRSAELDKGSAHLRQMVRHFDQVQPPPAVNAKDPKVSRALDDLLAQHRKFSKQKLAAPKIAHDVGGLFPGRIAVNAVPPFDFDHVLFGSGTGSNIATREASADRGTGQINVSAVSSSNKGFGGGSAYGVVGLYFHPFGSGHLTVRATPKFSFQWWTNSIRPTALVKSHGHVSLTIYAVDAYADTTGEVGTIVNNASTLIHSWNEEETNQVRFDFKFDLEAPGTVSMNVDHSLVYYLFIESQVGVHGVGWPGSLAGAKMSITVPSISYDYHLHPVLTQ